MFWNKNNNLKEKKVMSLEKYLNNLEYEYKYSEGKDNGIIVSYSKNCYKVENNIGKYKFILKIDCKSRYYEYFNIEINMNEENKKILEMQYSLTHDNEISSVEIEFISKDVKYPRKIKFLSENKIIGTISSVNFEDINKSIFEESNGYINLLGFLSFSKEFEEKYKNIPEDINKNIPEKILVNSYLNYLNKKKI